MTHLPNDHEQVDTSHSLQGRLGVQPADIGPTCRRKLQHSTLDLSCGRVDVPERNTNTGSSTALGMKPNEAKPSLCLIETTFNPTNA